MRITNEQNSVTKVTINLKVSMCTDIITNSNITKVFVVNPCDSCNTDVNTPLNAIHVRIYTHNTYLSIPDTYHHIGVNMSHYTIFPGRHESTTLPSSPDGMGMTITTTANIAYEQIKHGGRLEDEREVVSSPPESSPGNPHLLLNFLINQSLLSPCYLHSRECRGSGRGGCV